MNKAFLLAAFAISAGFDTLSIRAPSIAVGSACAQPIVIATRPAVFRVERHQKDSPTIPEGFVIPPKGLTYEDAAKVDEVLKNTLLHKYPNDDSTMLKIKLHLSAITSELEAKLKEQNVEFDVKDRVGNDLIVSAPMRRVYVLATWKEILRISLAD